MQTVRYELKYIHICCWYRECKKLLFENSNQTHESIKPMPLYEPDCDLDGHRQHHWLIICRHLDLREDDHKLTSSNKIYWLICSQWDTILSYTILFWTINLRWANQLWDFPRKRYHWGNSAITELRNSFWAKKPSLHTKANLYGNDSGKKHKLGHAYDGLDHSHVGHPVHIKTSQRWIGCSWWQSEKATRNQVTSTKYLAEIFHPSAHIGHMNVRHIIFLDIMACNIAPVACLGNARPIDATW